MPPSAIVIAVLIHSLWGGNPVAVKYSLLVFPPLWTAFFRFALALACVGLWAAMRGTRLVPRRDEWAPLALIGALFTVQITAMNVGFDLTTGSTGAVLIATNPLFAVLMHGTGAGALELRAWGNWIVLASACLLGLRLIISARVLRRMDEARVVFWQMLLSLPLFALGGAAFETIRWENIGWAPLAGIVYQGVVIAGIAFVVSFWLMKRYTPSVMVSFNFVSPVAGVLLSAWLLDDVITPALWLGMVLVAAGLYLIARTDPAALRESARLR